MKFDLVIRLEPVRDSNGAIMQYRPQDRYPNVRDLPLHRYGDGSFCKLQFPRGLCQSGVYAIAVSGQIKYIGECIDLSQRFGQGGYGLISPRNCFRGGQPTNCKVNQRLFQEFKRGSVVEVWFKESDQRKPRESRLIQEYSPEWNDR